MGRTGFVCNIALFGRMDVSRNTFELASKCSLGRGEQHLRLEWDRIGTPIRTGGKALRVLLSLQATAHEGDLPTDEDDLSSSTTTFH